MQKITKAVFSPEAESESTFLQQKAISSKLEKMILTSLFQKILIIKNNIHYGNPIAKELIPSEYKLKYGITNLFRIELPAFWRMFYTLVNGNNKDEIIIFILDILDHKEYDKKIGYRGK